MLTEKFIAVLRHPDGIVSVEGQLGEHQRDTYEEALADAERKLRVAEGETRSRSDLYATVERRLYLGQSPQSRLTNQKPCDETDQCERHPEAPGPHYFEVVDGVDFVRPINPNVTQAP